jgi:hypothetical protein
MDENSESRYWAFLELARAVGKHKEFETAFLRYRQSGLCRREALETTAWLLNLPGRPW